MKKILLLTLFSIISIHAQELKWMVFDLPPYGTVNKDGVLDNLLHEYKKEKFLDFEITRVNAARWYRDMTDSKNLSFCVAGSWKLPGKHRVYSDPITMVLDYGIVVTNRDLKKLTKEERKTKTLTLERVFELASEKKRIGLVKSRPLYGNLLETMKNLRKKHNHKVFDYSGSGGALKMLEIMNRKDRDVGFSIVFPAEIKLFKDMNKWNKFEFFILKNANTYPSVRTSCPNTKKGIAVIKKVNEILDGGVRQKATKDMASRLPAKSEVLNKFYDIQHCITKNSCNDPLDNERSNNISFY